MGESSLGRFSGPEGASLTTYVGVVRRRAWIIVVCLLVVPAVAYELSARQTAEYQSTASVYINQQDIANALTGISSYNSSSAALAINTQARLAAVPAVAASALKLAKLRDRAPESLLGATTITPDPTTNVLNFSVVDSSSATAGLLATSFARAFTRYSNGLASEPITRALAELKLAMANLAAQGGRHTSQYTNLAEKSQQLQTLQTLQTSGTTVIAAAGPGAKIAPHPKRDATLGLVLAIVLGLGLAFGMEALDTRVRSVGDLAQALGGLPQLGRIPPPTTEMQKRDDLAIVVQPRHSAAEAFRLLRTNLDFVRLSTNDVRTILITSGSEKEGKSTTAANLALAEARAGRRVALVDLDLRRPYLDRFFRISGTEGVTDVAIGRTDLQSALQRIDLRLGTGELGLGDPLLDGPDAPGAEGGGVLDVLASGQLPPDPGEFAASYRLAEILAELRASYDTVIIDTPPMLWVGDALTISSQADGLIVITRLKGLRWPMLRELRRVLDVVPARKLGYVITGPITGESGVYGKSDSYGYGYGYRSSAPAKKSKAGSDGLGTRR